MDRLAVRWFNKLEAEAAAAEYNNVAPGAPPSQFAESKMENIRTAEIWHGLCELFDDLAEEELRVEPQNRNDRWMRAYVSYRRKWRSFRRGEAQRS
jgi:hypothetical protein